MLDAGFTTLAYLKRQIFPDTMEDDTEWDEDLKRIGLAVAGQFDRHCNRGFARVENDVWDGKACVSSISLYRYPVESVSAAKVGMPPRDHDVLSNICSISKKSGIVDFGTTQGGLRDRFNVIYTGGYWLDDETVKPAGATALPADVVNAFVLQVQAVVGATQVLRNVSVNTTAEEVAALTQLRLIEMVELTLNPYRRFS